MTSFGLSPPVPLEAYELELDGRRFVFFEWDVRGRASASEVPLTRAQRAVLDGLLTGKSTREIALARGCAERTVANQIAAIFRKFGVHSRGELAAYFVNISGMPE